MSKPDQADRKLHEQIPLLETWIESQMAYREIPGLSVGIVHDQELVYANGFGFADLDRQTPATAETVYRIASITKTFTATALVQLKDAGKLRLDDPIREHLPWFEIQNPFPGSPEITIRQLITHTSGLPREAAFPYWTDHKFPTREQMIDKLPSQTAIFPPGTRIKYSNLGVALAGEVVASAANMAYAEYVQTHILEPLGMAHSAVIPGEQLRSEMATPYSRRLPGGTRTVMEYTDAKGISPAANMATNVIDMSKYIALQFREDDNQPSAVVRGSSLKEMHRVQWLGSDWQSGYGLGFSIWKRGEHTVCGHGGWVAGFRTQIMFIPSEKIGVIIMTNADDGEPAYFARHILDYILPLMAEAPPVAQKPDKSWDRYVGNYRDPWYFETQIMIMDDNLVMNTYSYPPEDELRSEIITLTPVAKDTFRMTGPNGNGELVVFEFDPAGEITRIKTGENYLYPARMLPFPGE